MSVFKSTVRIRIRVSKKLRPDPKNILIRIGNTHNFSKKILIKHSITGMTEEEINTFIRRLDKILHKVQDPPIFYFFLLFGPGWNLYKLLSRLVVGSSVQPGGECDGKGPGADALMTFPIWRPIS